MTRTRKQGGKGGALVALAIVVAVGAWNYHRNWTVERTVSQQRPFASYDRTALEELERAYAADLETARQRSGRRANARATARESELIGEAVSEFERVSRVAASRRDATATLAQHEARLAQVRAELAIRSGSQVVLLHLERLTGLPLTQL